VNKTGISWWFIFILIQTTCLAQEKDGPAKTKFKVLSYLNQISGKATIAGIHNREPNATPARWTDELYRVTGKYPGLWSGDFLFQADNINNRHVMIDEAVTQWRKGAAVNIMWHACNPALPEPCGWDSAGVLSKLTEDQWRELTTEGTALNKRWKSRVDEIVVYLQQLKEKGVEVIWRPMHEMNQGVFWWGGRPGPEGTLKLYRMLHDYMVGEKGLNNLVWVWDMQDFNTLPEDMQVYNPGNDYWDILALDVYDKTGFTLEKYNIIVHASAGKPMAIGECDHLPTAGLLKDQPRWVFFMGWSELEFSANTVTEISDLHHASNIITLDKMPGWNH
jgi:mannan endo-1,4-beta-mannosidase